MFKVKIFNADFNEVVSELFSKYGGLKIEDLSVSKEVGKDGEVAVITGTEKNENEIINYFRNLNDFDFNDSKMYIYFYEVKMEKMSYDPYDYLERSGSKMLW